MPGFGDVWAQISLDNLKHNLSIIKQCLDDYTRILTVVKADAYGHGLVEVARKLSEEGVDYFGVASIEEGRMLVESGIDTPILVLRSVLPEDMNNLLDRGLIPSVNCIALAESANLYGKLKKQKVRIHIRVDTGSDGEGIPVTECRGFLNVLSNMKWIDIEGIYTHLASAYGTDDNLVCRQLENFRSVIDTALSMGIDVPLIHAASSPAIFQYPEAHFNMVRVGTALYGIPFVKDDCITRLKPVLELKSRVFCIKEFKDGCSTGYGISRVEKKNLRIASVSIGYADAQFLLRAENLKVLIGGEALPVFGTAYMDHIKVDISDHDEVQIGDEVVVIGRQKDLQCRLIDAAMAAGISKVNCESICFFGKRVNRMYIENSVMFIGHREKDHKRLLTSV